VHTNGKNQRRSRKRFVTDRVNSIRLRNSRWHPFERRDVV